MNEIIIKPVGIVISEIETRRDATGWDSAVIEIYPNTGKPCRN